mgnify:CR=1 FL=1
MSPDERRRFARHLSLAEIGVAGQERIAASQVGAADGVDPVHDLERLRTTLVPGHACVVEP